MVYDELVARVRAACGFKSNNPVFIENNSYFIHYYWPGYTRPIGSYICELSSLHYMTTKEELTQQYISWIEHSTLKKVDLDQKPLILAITLTSALMLGNWCEDFFSTGAFPPTGYQPSMGYFPYMYEDMRYIFADICCHYVCQNIEDTNFKEIDENISVLAEKIIGNLILLSEDIEKKFLKGYIDLMPDTGSDKQQHDNFKYYVYDFIMLIEMACGKANIVEAHTDNAGVLHTNITKGTGFIVRDWPSLLIKDIKECANRFITIRKCQNAECGRYYVVEHGHNKYCGHTPRQKWKGRYTSCAEYMAFKLKREWRNNESRKERDRIVRWYNKRIAEAHEAGELEEYSLKDEKKSFIRQVKTLMEEKTSGNDDGTRLMQFMNEIAAPIPRPGRPKKAKEASADGERDETPK